MFDHEVEPIQDAVVQTLKPIIFKSVLASVIGSSPDPDNIQAIMKWRQQKSIKDNGRFIGMCSCYRGNWCLVILSNNVNSYLLVEIQVRSTTADWLYICRRFAVQDNNSQHERSQVFRLSDECGHS